MELNVVLTSVFFSALVTASMVTLNAVLDRRQRKKELIFKTAFELAYFRDETLKKLAENTGQTVYLLDPVYKAEDYHAWVSHFFDKGELPHAAKTKRKKEEEAYGM